MPTSRQLTPYERTQLARYAPNLDPDTFPAEMPIEYATGKVEFAGLTFAITQDALIPRIETEELVALAEAELRKMLSGATAGSPSAKKPLTVLDMGTGCGAIITCLVDRVGPEQRGQIKWIASEVSPGALTLARQNAEALLGADQPVSFIESDLWQSLPNDLIVDLLVANLPYIPKDRISYLDASVTAFEPHLALDGGTDGLQLIKKALDSAKEHTKTGSVIWLEVDYTHTPADLVEYDDDWLISCVLDSFTRNRFLRLERR